MPDRISSNLVFKSLLLRIVERGGSAIFNLIGFTIFARLFTPDIFGQYAIIVLVVSIGEVFVQSGLNTSLIHKHFVQHIDFDTVFWLSFVFSLVFYFGIFVLSPFITSYYDLPENFTFALRCAAGLLILNSLISVQVAKFVKGFEFHKTTKALFFSCLLSWVACLLTSLFWPEWELLILRLGLYYALQCLLLTSLSDWKPRIQFNMVLAREHFRYGIRIFLPALFNTIQANVIELVLGKVFGPHTLGLLTQGKRYPIAVSALCDGVVQPIFLSGVAKVQNNLDLVRKVYCETLQMSSFFTFGVMALFFITAPEVIPLMLGDAWKESVIFFQLYSLISLFTPLFSIFSSLLQGLGRVNDYAKIEIFKNLSQLICLGLFIEFFSSISLVLTSLIIANLLSLCFYYRKVKVALGLTIFAQFTDLFLTFLVSVLASIITFVICSFNISASLLFLSKLICFMTSYFCCAYIFKLSSLGLLCNFFVKNIFLIKK